jgi:hypothetical protein
MRWRRGGEASVGEVPRNGMLSLRRRLGGGSAPGSAHRVSCASQAVARRWSWRLDMCSRPRNPDGTVEIRRWCCRRISRGPRVRQPRTSDRRRGRAARVWRGVAMADVPRERWALTLRSAGARRDERERVRTGAVGSGAGTAPPGRGRKRVRGCTTRREDEAFRLHRATRAARPIGGGSPAVRVGGRGLGVRSALLLSAVAPGMDAGATRAAETSEGPETPCTAS